MKRKKYKAIFMTALCITALSGCGGDTTASDTPKDNAAVTDTTSENAEAADHTPSEAALNVGTFTTTDINGKAFDQSLFSQNDLTLVNVFATWCGPCVKEIPELQRVQDELGVPVVAVVLDGTDGEFMPVESVLEDAKYLAEQANASFPMILPEKTGLNGALFDVTAVPYTFFVDKTGNIVGEPYVGGRDFKEWKKVIENDFKK